MASMFTSLCEFHSSCIVYQFSMFKTGASSVDKSASPSLQYSTPAVPKSHPFQHQANFALTLNCHVPKGEIRKFESISFTEPVPFP